MRELDYLSALVFLEFLEGRLEGEPGNRVKSICCPIRVSLHDVFTERCSAMDPSEEASCVPCDWYILVIEGRGRGWWQEGWILSQEFISQYVNFAVQDSITREPSGVTIIVLVALDPYSLAWWDIRLVV